MDATFFTSIGLVLLTALGTQLVNKLKNSAKTKDWVLEQIVLQAMRLAEKYLRDGKKTPTNEELKKAAMELLREYIQRQSDVFRNVPDEVLDAKIEKLAAEAKKLGTIKVVKKA